MFVPPETVATTGHHSWQNAASWISSEEIPALLWLNSGKGRALPTPLLCSFQGQSRPSLLSSHPQRHHAHRMGDLVKSRPGLPTDPPVFLRTVPGFSRGKASGRSSSYHVAVVPVMGRLFSRPGLLSAASSSRICTGQRREHRQGQLHLRARCSQAQSCGCSPHVGPSLKSWI